ncbi:hypothetical protein BDW02DRAFT_602739 [Decorospora gaudefroyi]|uniref:DUF7025 domain-containing protein n=1 Tax=Decorospora gaudefroyi TaxID=184978 RepID=A0A6A5JWX6_9PLEO|nr:hypothetical protein BDW02DRAFT_602739 [Decorospora gaudefroyi]
MEFEVADGPVNQVAVWRRRMCSDDDKRLLQEELEIHSPGLIRLLAETSPAWKDIINVIDKFVVTDSPFYEFIWHWDALQALCQPQEADSDETRLARKDLRDVLQLVGNSLDWNGHNFSAYKYDFYIGEFTGEKPISNLGVVPVEYFRDARDGSDATRLCMELTERGRKYFRLCTETPTTYQCAYQGPALVAASTLRGSASKGRHEWTSLGDVDQASHDVVELDVVSIDISGSQSRVIADNF